MDGESNETQRTNSSQGERQQAQGSEASAQEEATRGKHATASGEAADHALDIGAAAYEAQIAGRDMRIAELEVQIAEASKNAETADGLRAEIAALKEQGESDRIDFRLRLAGCRNVKAARAVLDDHGGDVDKLKEAEPSRSGNRTAPFSARS